MAAPGSTAQTLELARGAHGRHAWREAFELLVAADQDRSLGAADLVRLGDAAYWAGHLEASLGAMERAYAACRAQGDDQGAALVALSLRLDYTTVPALATASGWLRRAERILRGQPVCLAHGYLAGVRQINRLGPRGGRRRALRRRGRRARALA